MSKSFDTSVEKLIPAAFYIIVFGAALFIVGQCLLGDIPVGAFGQPRTSKIEPDWAIPTWLIAIYLLSIISLLISTRYPLAGVVAYLFVTFLPAIHTSPWIYTQWNGVRTIIAILAFAGAILYRYQTEDGKWIFNDQISILFSMFLVWYMICAAAAYFRDGQYSPPLQFHPFQLIEAFALYSIIRINKNREESLLVIAFTMALIVIIRSVWIEKWLIRDADIAGITVISSPLIFFGFTYFKQWWLRLIAFLFGSAGICLVIYIQNRGAVVGLLFMLIAFWMTSNKKLITTLFGIPIVVMGSIIVFLSNLGDRFLSIGSLRHILTENLRIITWRGGVNMGLDHFLFGVGPGNFLYKIGDYVQQVRHHSAHNIFIDTFAESGLVGLLLYFFLITTVLWLCYNQARTGYSSCRFVFMALFAYIGVGMFLSQTMMVIPFILFAIPVTSRT